MKALLACATASLALFASSASAASFVVGSGSDSGIVSANDFKSNLEALGLPVLRTSATLGLSGPARIKVELLGSESGAVDRLTIGGQSFTQDPDGNFFAAPVLLGSFTFNNPADFQIAFSSSLSNFETVHAPGSSEFGYFLPAPVDTARGPGSFTSSVLYLGYDNQITATDDDNHDDLVIRLTATAVPEPATWAMMIAGFGAVGYAARRRRVGYAIA